MPLVFTKTCAMVADVGLAITQVAAPIGCLIRGKVLPEHRTLWTAAWLWCINHCLV